ncbi:MAG: tetratricopeptide repeat protein [Acidobacteriota bacterium]
MSEARIGRVLVASLHQAIADVLPDRLEFYENWLNARGLRRGTIGLAAVTAVLSFLRGEGEVYADIVTRAGEHAAEWSMMSMGRVRRAMILSLPRAIRARMAMSLARSVIREAYADSRAITKSRRGLTRVEIRASLFCEVRERTDRMLCGFYLALVRRLLELHDVSSQSAIDGCRAVGSRACSLVIQTKDTGRARVVTSALLIVLLAGGVSGAAQQQPSQPAPTQSNGRLLVVPFENPTRDPALYWLTEAAAILLTDAVNDQGGNAITRADRVRAFDMLHLPEATVLSRATVIKVGQLVGAWRVVVGDIKRVRPNQADAPTSNPTEDDELVVHVRAVRLDTGRLEPEIMERAKLKQLFDLFQRIAGRLLARVPSVVAPDARAPLPAFESYVKGLMAENSDTRVRYLEAALKHYPQYDRAHLALWEARSDRGEYAQALAAARAIPESSSLARRARFFAALSLMDLRRYDDACDALKELNAEQANAALLNDLGVVQIRRGWTAQSGKPAYYFDRAVAADPTDSNLYFNLGYAYALDNDPQAAIYWLRETLRRDPADAEAHFLLGTVLHSAGSNPVEAQRELELARQLSSSYETLAGHPLSDRKVPAGLERPSRQLEPFRSAVEEAIASPAQREQREMASFHLDRARRLVEQEHDREAEAELRRAIYLSPYNADAHLLLGRVYLRTGRVTDAIGALKISIWSQDTAPARVALGEAFLRSGDRPAAREQAQRALALAPDSAEARALLARVP